MSVKDWLLALCVVVAWGANFVVIKVGLQGMPPFLLAGLRFTLVALPAVFFVPRPRLPLRWLVAYGMTISFGQFAFLFLAIKLGMPAGIASLVLQAQGFFTLLLGALLLGEALRWNHFLGIAIATLGMFVLAEGGMLNQTTTGLTLLTMLLTLGGALSWAFGNISNKVIMSRHGARLNVMSLVVWSALVPIGPFFLCSWMFDGQEAIVASLTNMHMTTVLALGYLAFVATIMGFGIWSSLLGRYETWRVAPLTLLVPVFGMLSAALFLDEHMTLLQVAGALLIMVGLLVNVFGGRLALLARARSTS
ncbi:EamA family transporter [Symbiopectobacterium sp. Eva_TO]